MVMRMVMILVLVFALTGCLKKAADENVSVEPAATEQAATAVTNATQGTQADTQASTSVEPAKAVSMEKPSFQDIQQALANAKLYEGKIDGIPGPKTRKAIEAFQTQNGLKADGKVGSRTWQKLKEYLNKKAQ